MCLGIVSGAEVGAVLEPDVPIYSSLITRCDRRLLLAM